MNGNEFVRAIKRIGKERGVGVRLDKAHGKGSHGTLFLGDRRTTVKHSEIGPGLLAKMLRQLGLTKRDLR
jgi:mRNA interferase HicA